MKALPATSSTQAQVAALLREGQLNKQIAVALAITEGAVKYHVAQLTRKHGFNNRTQLAVVLAKQEWEASHGNS